MKVWRDKKHFLWWVLPWSAESYEIDNMQITLKIGLTSQEIQEVQLCYVQDMKVFRTLMDRICGTGTVTIYSTDYDNPEVELKNISDPLKVQKLIMKRMRKSRDDNGIRENIYRDAYNGPGNFQPQNNNNNNRNIRGDDFM